MPNLATILPTIAAPRGAPHFSRSRYIVPWHQLTRYAMPKFRIARRALFFNNQHLQPGTEIPAEMVANRVRVRQLYEQWLIEPVAETVVSRPGVNVVVRSESTVAATFAPVESIPTALPAAPEVAAVSEFYIPDITLPVEVEEDAPTAQAPSDPQRRHFTSYQQEQE